MKRGARVTSRADGWLGVVTLIGPRRTQGRWVTAGVMRIHVRYAGPDVVEVRWLDGPLRPLKTWVRVEEIDEVAPDEQLELL